MNAEELKTITSALLDTDSGIDSLFFITLLNDEITLELRVIKKSFLFELKHERRYFITSLKYLKKKIKTLNLRIHDRARGRCFSQIRWPHRSCCVKGKGRFIGSIYGAFPSPKNKVRRLLSFAVVQHSDRELLEVSDATGEPDCFWLSLKCFAQLQSDLTRLSS